MPSDNRVPLLDLVFSRCGWHGRPQFLQPTLRFPRDHSWRGSCLWPEVLWCNVSLSQENISKGAQKYIWFHSHSWGYIYWIAESDKASSHTGILYCREPPHFVDQSCYTAFKSVKEFVCNGLGTWGQWGGSQLDGGQLKKVPKRPFWARVQLRVFIKSTLFVL